MEGKQMEGITKWWTVLLGMTQLKMEGMTRGIKMAASAG